MDARPYSFEVREATMPGMLRRRDNSHSARERGALLLTGATGFVGMEILGRYLERTDRLVYALVRAPGRAAAARRLEEVLTSRFGGDHRFAGRVVAVPADVERPLLGLARADREALAGEVTDIVHAAASVSFSLPLAESRAINVTGTRRMLELAELCVARGGLRRFSHISTAYVAGTHRGEFREDDLEVGQGFRNAYERSKFEAELLVRERAASLPIQVLRPSIVVGERDSGWTASFNVLYSPLRAFAHGALPALPARRGSPVDVVPVDYVADAVFELTSKLGRPGETYHLVAGRQASTVGSVVELSAAGLGRRSPPMMPPRLYRRVIHPLLVRRGDSRRRRALERNSVLFPYFSMHTTYDDRRARRALEPGGITATPVESYFDRLLEFALAAEWGRRKVGRAEARATLARRDRGETAGAAPPLLRTAV